MSEDFWLRELKGLRPFVEDVIRSSEVITSEQFGPFNPKYREFAQGIHHAARQLMSFLVQIDESEKCGKDSQIRQFLAEKPLVIIKADKIHTPLNAIIGFSEMIKMDLYGPIGDPYLTYVEGFHASAVLFLHACWDMENVARASQSP